MSDRELAPEPLAVVQSFVNTADLETGEDELRTAAGLRSWLVAKHLIDPAAAVVEEDVRRAAAAREALRDLLAANAGEAASPAALDTLDAVAARARFGMRFDGSGQARLEPEAHGTAGALGRILSIVSASQADGTWSRLKVCREDTCRWAFYDASRNHSGVWCTMAVCGNREKVRSYRSRRRTVKDTPTSPSAERTPA